MLIWPTDPAIYRRIYAEDLVGLQIRVRPETHLKMIVDWKEDGGGLGLYLIIEGCRDEVYHPYPEQLLPDKGHVWPIRTVHTILRPSTSPPIVAPGRTVVRAEPGPR